MLEIYKDISIITYIDPLSSDVEEEKKKHAAYIKNRYYFYNYGIWGIFLHDGTLIGRCGIEDKEINEKIEVHLGYVIKKEYQGKGIATACSQLVLDYAFTHLELTRITALIHADNKPSIRVADKLGMVLEDQIFINNSTYLLYVIEG